MKLLYVLGPALCCVALAQGALRAAAEQSLPLPDHPRFAFQKLSEQLSLATETVTCMVQDQQGFLWIGTQNGLFRYDGANVTEFSAAQGLSSMRIVQLIVSPKGEVWVATEFGIWRYARGRFEELLLPGGHKIHPASQMVALDNDNHAYVIVDDGGVLRLNVGNPGDFGMVQTEPVSELVRAPDDSILVAWKAVAGKTKVGRISQRGQVIEAFPGELPEPEVFALVMDGSGDVWARTARHFSRWDRARKRWMNDDAGIPGAVDFGYPTVDGKGEILLPTIRGLYRRNHGRWEVISEKEGLATNAVFAAFEDRDGAIWVGFGGGGVERWPGPNEWLGWSKQEGLPDSVVWTIARDHQRRLWVGTNDGLGMWDPLQHKWKIWRAKDGLAGGTVRQVLVTPDDSLWALCIPGGLTRVDLKTLRLQPIKAPERPKSQNPAYARMAASPRGGVWVGGADFIDEYKVAAGRVTRTVMPIPHEAELAVSGLSLSPDGVMWGAGRKGVTRFDGKRWRLITARDGLLMDFVDVIRAVSGSEAWVNYFEPKGATRIRVGKDGRLELKHYSTRDGLASNSLYLIANDRNGNVWLGGDLGLSIVHPDGTITNQDRSSGLLWNDVSAEAAFEDADGGLFIGTSRGLAYRRPNTPATKNTVPSTVLTSATFAGKEMLFSPNPQIVYKNGTFHAHFAAPALDGPTGLRCKYQLHGLESEPVETTLSQVRYTALPAGDFLFEVSCGSATRGWSSPVTYKFVVLPPWWQRGWARIAFGVLLVLFILWIIALRTRNLEKQRQRLEEAVAARSAELSAANKRLEEASLKDPLTGVRNRRFFEVTTPRDAQQTIRAYQTASSTEPPRDRDLAFFLMDLDHFKNTNDTFGHATGDEVLVAVARRLTSVIRDTDVLVRWGGEEFLIVSQGTSAEGAQHVAQRILDVIGEKSFETSDGHTVLLTCSVGWAVFPWIVKVPVAVPVDEIIKLADRALYQAKQDGRNRAVGLYPDEKLEESPLGQQKARPRAVQVMGPAPVMPRPEKRR